jgi:hypothetical protein
VIQWFLNWGKILNNKNLTGSICHIADVMNNTTWLWHIQSDNAMSNHFHPFMNILSFDPLKTTSLCVKMSGM